MLTCTICWEIYESNSGNIVDGCPCPKKICLGHIADIDELLLPAIILLNDKGYLTEYCCSGHFHAGTSDSAYILFVENLKHEALPVLPKGFKFDMRDKNVVCIRRELKAKDQFDLHRKVVEASIDVLEWARTIAPFPDFE